MAGFAKGSIKVSAKLIRAFTRSQTVGLLQLAQLAPAFVLLGLGGIGSFFVLEPKLEPVNVALIDLIAMFWLVFYVKFVRIDEHFNRLLQFSKSSNLEEMGYGTPYDKIDAPPLSLAKSFEVFSGLNRLNKPVELYYYPNESHEPNHPQARLATMQRNVDWYRFWLKGEEDPDPAKAEQYKRWRELRKLQTAQQQPTTQKPN